jgi:hypothetical protein
VFTCSDAGVNNFVFEAPNEGDAITLQKIIPLTRAPISQVAHIFSIWGRKRARGKRGKQAGHRRRARSEKGAGAKGARAQGARSEGGARGRRARGEARRERGVRGEGRARGRGGACSDEQESAEKPANHFASWRHEAFPLKEDALRIADAIPPSHFSPGILELQVFLLARFERTSRGERMRLRRWTKNTFV